MRLTTIGLMTTLALGLLTGPLTAEAQADKVYRIGFLTTASTIEGTTGEITRQALRDLGYVEGQNIVIEWRFTQGKKERLPALVDELVRLRVDVLVTASMRLARAAKNATRTIPIVFLSSPDPVAAGLVDSLARPGGNLTGVTYFSTALAGKRLELLKKSVPQLSRVAVLWNPGNPGSERIWKESQLAAPGLGLQLHSMAISRVEEFEDAFQVAMKGGSTALAVTQGALINSNREQITDLAIKSGLPAIYTDSRFVRSGGLMSYGTDRPEQVRRAATYVDKILKGAKPADLPVEQPTKFELIVNLKTAKQLGITIPASVLYRADKVIR